MTKLLKRITVRSLIFTIITFAAYVLSIIYLFGLHDIFGSITFIFATFIFFHFLFLDIKNIKIWRFIVILAWLSVIEIVVFWLTPIETNSWIVLSLLAFNASVWALFYSLEMVDFNSISYFTRWWYIFTLCISIMYSIAFVGMFQSFPFTCQWLNDASNKMFEFVEKPFIMVKKRHLKEIDPSNKLNENVSNLVENINDMDVSSSKWSTENPIIEKINEFKSKTIDAVLADKTEYSDWVCDLLLGKINNILNSWWVKRSVILLSYLLLYWFIRIAIFVMSGVAFIIFKILYRCKVYKISKITKKVDEID